MKMPKNRCASIANLAPVDWEERRTEAEKDQPEFSLFHSNILFTFSFLGGTQLFCILTLEYACLSVSVSPKDPMANTLSTC